MSCVPPRAHIPYFGKPCCSPLQVDNNSAKHVPAANNSLYNKPGLVTAFLTKVRQTPRSATSPFTVEKLVLSNLIKYFWAIPEIVSTHCNNYHSELEKWLKSIIQDSNIKTTAYLLGFLFTPKTSLKRSSIAGRPSVEGTPPVFLLLKMD